MFTIAMSLLLLEPEEERHCPRALLAGAMKERRQTTRDGRWLRCRRGINKRHAGTRVGGAGAGATGSLGRPSK